MWNVREFSYLTIVSRGCVIYDGGDYCTGLSPYIFNTLNVHEAIIPAVFRPRSAGTTSFGWLYDCMPFEKTWYPLYPWYPSYFSSRSVRFMCKSWIFGQPQVAFSSPIFSASRWLAAIEPCWDLCPDASNRVESEEMERCDRRDTKVSHP